ARCFSPMPFPILEPRSPNHESRITKHKSQITNHELRITNYGTRIPDPAPFAVIPSAGRDLLQPDTFRCAPAIQSPRARPSAHGAHHDHAASPPLHPSPIVPSHAPRNLASTDPDPECVRCGCG